MKPLVIVTVYNRKRETQVTLEALAETTDLGEIELVIVDNGSSDGAGDVVDTWQTTQGEKSSFTTWPTVHHLETNVGIPRALNVVIEAHRQPGQPIVKWDNDVKCLTEGWARAVEQFVEYQRQVRPVALVRAWRDGTQVESAWREEWGGFSFYVPQHKLGYAVWYTGEFVDQVGYFDVLAPEHLYGFEDVLICHKAAAMGWVELMWEGWRIEDIQRSSALRGKREHVEAMRPLFHARLRALQRGGPLRTGPDGQPDAGDRR